MPSAKPDRRIARTQHRLQQALLALTLRKDYEAVTVEELCEHADVGRSTFYEHFRGKDDLKRSGLRELEATLAAQTLPSASTFAFSLPLLRHARSHLRHIQALGRGRGREVSFRAVGALVQRLVAKELVAGRPMPAQERDIAVRFYAGAFMAVLQAWLDSGAHTEPEQVDAVVRRLVGGAAG